MFAHNGHIYWGELRGSRTLNLHCLVPPAQGPHCMWPGRVKGSRPGLGTDQLFPWPNHPSPNPIRFHSLLRNSWVV